MPVRPGLLSVRSVPVLNWTGKVAHWWPFLELAGMDRLLAAIHLDFETKYIFDYLRI